MIQDNDFQFDKLDLNFLIRLKLHEFRQSGVTNLTSKQIKDYLFNVKWKNNNRVAMRQIVDDVMTLEVSELFDYLSLQVVKDARNMKLNDFNELIFK